MGQAALDLPDPSAKTNAPASSADDILSQLAGEEIDRLLAEAEAGQPAEKAAEVFTSKGQVRHAVVRAEEPEAPAVPATAIDQAEIDKLLAAATASEPAPVPPAPPPPEEAETSTAERSALEGVSEAIEQQVRADENAPDPASSIDASLPLFLKPLEWLDAPLRMFPESVRQAVGKIAILTLLNALAVIIYVIVFRKPHH